MNTSSQNYFGLRFLLLLSLSVLITVTATDGIAIMQAIQQYNISHEIASYIGISRDSAKLVACLFYFFLIRLNYKQIVLMSLVVVAITCALFPFIDTFYFLIALFAISGAGYAIAKICIYSTIPAIIKCNKERTSSLSSMEGFCGLFCLIGFWIFSQFLNFDDGKNWSYFYLVLAFIIAIIFFLWIIIIPKKVQVNESKITLADEYKEGFKFIKNSNYISIVTALCALFFCTYIEGAISSWLPIFEKEIINVSPAISAIMASFFIASVVLSRLIAFYFFKKIDWYYVFMICMLGAILILGSSLFFISHLNISETLHEYKELPFVAYCLPFVGCFIGPVYPILISTIFTKVIVRNYNFITILIMFFSILGGVFGIRITGVLFEHRGGIIAFCFILIPMLLLMVVVWLQNISWKTKKSIKEKL